MPELEYRHLDVQRDGAVLILIPRAAELRGAKLSTALLHELTTAHTENGASTQVIVDLRHVTYLASLGLAALIRFRRYLNNHGARLLLCHVSPFLADVLHGAQLAGADAAFFPFADDHVAALHLLQTARS